jgi:hypothetical protein
VGATYNPHGAPSFVLTPPRHHQLALLLRVVSIPCRPTCSPTCATMPTASPPLSAARAHHRGEVLIRFLTPDSLEHPLVPGRSHSALPLPSSSSHRRGATAQAAGTATRLLAPTSSSSSCRRPPVIDAVPSHPYPFPPPPRAPHRRTAPAATSARFLTSSVFL